MNNFNYNSLGQKRKNIMTINIVIVLTMEDLSFKCCLSYIKQTHLIFIFYKKSTQFI